MNDHRYCEIADLAEAKPQLDEIRHHIHQHSELSYEEANTSDFVAAKLEAWGYVVTRNIGRHGLVALLTAGTGARTVGVCTDMDALPIQELTGLDYASIHAGKCTHAVTTATPPFCSARRSNSRTRATSTAPCI